MPKVFINKPISVNLTADSADTVHLKPGLQDVSQELADHWFVKAHCQDLSELTDDTAANEVIAQLETQLASAQTELETAKLSAGEHEQKSAEANTKVTKLEADLASKTKLASDAATSLKKAETESKAKDDRIAALEKELAAAKAKSTPAADKPA